MMYLAFDTETTGLPINPGSTNYYDTSNWPRIYQLSAILFDEFGFEYGTVSSYVKPNGWKIPELSDLQKELGMVSFHEEQGVTTAMLEELGRPLKKVIEEFILLADKADAKVCHNLAFDDPVILCEFFRCKHFPQGWVQKEAFCTKLMSEPVLKIPSHIKGKYKWPTLQEAHTHLLGYEFDGAHDAINDVRATKDVFLELINL